MITLCRRVGDELERERGIIEEGRVNELGGGSLLSQMIPGHWEGEVQPCIHSTIAPTTIGPSIGPAGGVFALM